VAYCPPAGSETMVDGLTAAGVGLFVHVGSPGLTVSVTVQFARPAVPLLWTVIVTSFVPGVPPHADTVEVHCLTTFRPGVRHRNRARSNTGVMLTPGTLLQPQFRVAVSGSAPESVSLQGALRSAAVAEAPTAIVPIVTGFVVMPEFDSVTAHAVSGAVPV